MEDHKEIVAASDLGFLIMPHNGSHHFVIFKDKMNKEAKLTSLVGEGATHRERML